MTAPEHRLTWLPPTPPAEVVVARPVETNSMFERALDAAKNVVVIFTCLAVLWVAYRAWRIVNAVETIGDLMGGGS